MSFTGLYFTPGGWIMFGILFFITLALLCLAVAFGTFSRLPRFRSSEYGFFAVICGFFALGGCLFSGIAIDDGLTNQRAYIDLTDAGYGVDSIATSSDAAIITTDNERQRVSLYESPSTGLYTAYLLCPVGVSYSDGDASCISQPSE